MVSNCQATCHADFGVAGYSGASVLLVDLAQTTKNSDLLPSELRSGFYVVKLDKFRKWMFRPPTKRKGTQQFAVGRLNLQLRMCPAWNGYFAWGTN